MGKSIVGCQESKNPAEIRQVFSEDADSLPVQQSAQSTGQLWKPQKPCGSKVFDAAKKYGTNAV